MTQYEKITGTSRVLGYVCLTLLILLPCYLAHHWLLPVGDWIDGMPLAPRIINEAQWPPSLPKQLAGISLSYLPGLFFALVLLNLGKLFKTYSTGDFFSGVTVKHYSAISSYAFWFVISGIVAQSLLSILLSFDGPSPHVSVTFTHTHLFAVFGVTILRLVTWIMAVGHELQNENESFV